MLRVQRNPVLALAQTKMAPTGPTPSKVAIEMALQQEEQKKQQLLEQAGFAEEQNEFMQEAAREADARSAERALNSRAIMEEAAASASETREAHEFRIGDKDRVPETILKTMGLDPDEDDQISKASSVADLALSHARSLQREKVSARTLLEMRRNPDGSSSGTLYQSAPIPWKGLSAYALLPAAGAIVGGVSGGARKALRYGAIGAVPAAALTALGRARGALYDVHASPETNTLSMEPTRRGFFPAVADNVRLRRRHRQMERAGIHQDVDAESGTGTFRM